MSERQPSVGIVGAGMSGLCQAILLRKAGITDVTIYEKSGDVGGTWRDNTYPGLSCDVPSRFYQFTFAMNPDWTRHFSPGSEIFEYFRSLTDEYALTEVIRFGVDVVDARFTEGRWLLTTAAGEEMSHDFLIAATGVLRVPRTPAINGLAEFDGPVMHSARWNHAVDMAGKRIAVIGTGSTGVQIVCGLADSAGRLDLFQRSAQWILPLPNPSYRRWTGPMHRRMPVLSSMAYYVNHLMFEWLARALVKPGWRRRLMSSACRANLRTVRDPDLRRRLTPDYQPMCRRLIMSADFYPAIQRPNVRLVDSAIDHVEQRGIVTADGSLHELDAIVLATGFDAHAFMRPMSMVGRDGLTLQQLWEEGPKAHLGVALPGFPNFFMLTGPNTGLAHGGNQIFMTECAVRHMMLCLRELVESGKRSIECRADVYDNYNREVDAMHARMVWTHKGMTNWYRNSHGRVFAITPWRLVEYWKMTSHFNSTKYEMR